MYLIIFLEAIMVQVQVLVFLFNQPPLYISSDYFQASDTLNRFANYYYIDSVVFRAYLGT